MKFLDLTGLGTFLNKVKELIPTKTSDIANDANFISAVPLTSPVRIWDLDNGLYKIPSGCVIYYYGQSDETNSITISTTGYMFVTSYSTTYKNWYILCGNTSTTRYLYNGYTTSSKGGTKAFNIGSSYLTAISSYVKNELTYSTSNTTYALSAYQGYILNQNKADKTELPTKTSDLTNDSNFIQDASYVHTDNNFTTILKNKLDAIAEGAQVNVIETIKVNNSALTPDANKAVNITVPTKTSDITNNSNFVSDSSYVHTDNNFTTTLKNKLDAIAAGAQVNVIETIKVNNSALTPDANKAVDITVPTKTSDLTNDSGFGDVSTKQNQATYSTTDITAGTTALTTGDIYLVYQ